VGLIVGLSPSDEARLGADELLALTVYDETRNRRELRQQPGPGACIALREVGGVFTCTIYERRPDACREFERGSRRCLFLRDTRNLP
jgi:Fe-S-cluster containining protein